MATPFPTDESPSPIIRPGMVINMRRRMWRVEEIAGDVLTATPIDDFGARSQQFLLDLESIHPGTLPPPALETLGDTALQSLFLQAVRLDALHGAAPFVSIQRTAVVPVEYQLVPLVMALRQQPARLLLADGVGLGKTIEAGVILSELLARGRARSVLIIAPASLREQWRQQMHELFHLDFEIMSSDTRKRLERMIPPGADPWLYFDRLIVSIDFAKDLKVRPEIIKRKWDLVIVDEAHNASMPHSSRGRRADMDRWETIEKIADHASRHLLLLTATPHNGYTDSYCSLLRMLSPDLVEERSGEVQPNRGRAVHHVCQRTRIDVQKWFEEAGEKYPFPAREPESTTEVGVELHRDYFKILQRLDTVLDYVVLHAERAGRSQPLEWLRLHLHRRALSSPEALKRSLENRIEKLKALSQAQEDVSERDDPLLASLQDQGASDVESEDERDRAADKAVLSIEQKLQLRHFEELLVDLKKITPAKDRKLTVLRDQVLPELFARTGPNTLARIIVFTRFKDTLTYLERELGKGADYSLETMHGDLSQAERDRRFEGFAASEKAVLLATDVISEGLNLQTTACKMVHFDLPWNPNRLQQRFGRIDRFGQRAPVVYERTLFCRDTTDEDVMVLLVRKLESMRRDLGFSPPFFATDETVLRVLARRRKRRSEHPEGQLTLWQSTEEDEELFDESAVKKMQSEGFYGQADVRIRDVSERLREVHARIGSPDQIRTFIKHGLTRYGCAIDERKNGTLSIEIKNARLKVPGVPPRLETVVLDPEERNLFPSAVVLDVGHPLIRRLNAVIREDALRQSAEGARTAAYYVAGQRGTVLLGHGLLRATAATTPPTLLEEVVSFGIRSGLSGIQPLTPEEVSAAMEAAPSAQPVARDEALSRIRESYGKSEWEAAQGQVVERLLHRLRDYRSQMKAELEGSGETGASWLEGFEDVQAVGFDLFCLTLLLPERL